MRKIERNSQFKRDYKREAKGNHRESLKQELIFVLSELANDRSLPDNFRDHALVGEWKDYRDCHIKPDLILIYRKPDGDILQLVRLGSHGELGL